MDQHFNKTTPATIARADIGSILYVQQKDAPAMQRLGKIADVHYVEVSDGRDNWTQCGATVDFIDKDSMTLSRHSHTTYYLLRPEQSAPEPKPAPQISTLRSVAIRAANKVVGAQLDFDLRPDNPNGAAAIEIAEYEFDAAVKKLSEALTSTTN